VLEISPKEGGESKDFAPKRVRLNRDGDGVRFLGSGEDVRNGRGGGEKEE